MRYQVGGREKLLALGEWPHTSLKRARERRDEAHRLLAYGIDPAAKKRPSAKRSLTPSPPLPKSIWAPIAAP